MKFSELFTTTTKKVGEEIKSKSHEFLIRGGFIHQEMAGIYTILPLGAAAAPQGRGGVPG